MYDYAGAAILWKVKSAIEAQPETAQGTTTILAAGAIFSFHHSRQLLDTLMSFKGR